MEKSKQILTKSLKMIIITSFIILFLEIDCFASIRFSVSNSIVMFQGKGTLISNICLGILGSAVLTFVSEHAEYVATKKRLQRDILRAYDKWHKKIEPETLDQIDDVLFIELIGSNICQYWGEVYLLYNSYLPYNRKDVFVKLIRALYEYINEFQRYLDFKQDIQRRRDENLKNIKGFNEVRAKYPADPEINNKVDAAIELTQKILQDLDSDQDNKEEWINSINRKRDKLDEMSSKAFGLEVCFKLQDVEHQDIEQDILDIKIRLMKYEIQEYFNKFNYFIKKPLVQCKNLIRKIKK